MRRVERQVPLLWRRRERPAYASRRHAARPHGHPGTTRSDSARTMVTLGRNCRNPVTTAHTARVNRAVHISTCSPLHAQTDTPRQGTLVLRCRYAFMQHILSMKRLREPLRPTKRRSKNRRFLLCCHDGKAVPMSRQALRTKGEGES